jgi:hypothetical protein
MASARIMRGRVRVGARKSELSFSGKFICDIKTNRLAVLKPVS